MPLIPALGRPRQEEQVFELILVIQQVPEQPGLHRETRPQKKKRKENKTKKP
jgi:hypothetical protein